MSNCIVLENNFAPLCKLWPLYGPLLRKKLRSTTALWNHIVDESPQVCKEKIYFQSKLPQWINSPKTFSPVYNLFWCFVTSVQTVQRSLRPPPSDEPVICVCVCVCVCCVCVCVWCVCVCVCVCVCLCVWCVCVCVCVSEWVSDGVSEWVSEWVRDKVPPTKSLVTFWTSCWRSKLLCLPGYAGIFYNHERSAGNSTSGPSWNEGCSALEGQACDPRLRGHVNKPLWQPTRNKNVSFQSTLCNTAPQIGWTHFYCVLSCLYFFSFF